MDGQEVSALIGPVVWVVVAVPIIIGLGVWLWRESLRLPRILRRARRDGAIPIGYVSRDPAQLVVIQPVASNDAIPSDGESEQLRGATLWRYRGSSREAVTPERVWLLAKASEFTWLYTHCFLPPRDMRHTFSGGLAGWALMEGLRDFEALLDNWPDEHTGLRREIEEALDTNQRPPGYLEEVRWSLR